MQSRPTGVTIIAILMIIGGIIMLIAGILFAVLAAIFPLLDEAGEIDQGLRSSSIPAELVGIFFPTFGAIMIILGIASMAVAYGLFKGRGWAWTITLILSFISIALAIVSLVTGNFGGIVSIIISGVIIYYLYRPHVKAWFGKELKTGSSTT